MGDTTDQVITPVGKVDARCSHAGNYTTNKIYCGNLLWQSSLTLPYPESTVPDEALTDEDEDILNYDDLDDPDAFV